MSIDPGHRSCALALLSFAVAPALAQVDPATLQIKVYKSPTCGCCSDWIKLLENSGFTVSATNVPDSRFYRARFGVPSKYGSCHTGLTGDYMIEGHVPAKDIKRLLREKPSALGPAVPGMPIGSPGMDTPSYNGHVDPYDVLLVQAGGRARVHFVRTAGAALMREFCDRENETMNKPRILAALVLGIAVAAPAVGQHAGHGAATKPAATASTEQADGEVRRVDKARSAVVLKHGEVRNLGMGAMTMTFKLQDPAMADQLASGDKVRFSAIQKGDELIVTSIRKAP